MQRGIHTSIIFRSLVTNHTDTITARKFSCDQLESKTKEQWHYISLQYQTNFIFLKNQNAMIHLTVKLVYHGIHTAIIFTSPLITQKRKKGQKVETIKYKCNGLPK